MIGDSTWDAQAAGKLGVPTFAVRTGGFSGTELCGAGAIAVYDSLRPAGRPGPDHRPQLTRVQRIPLRKRLGIAENERAPAPQQWPEMLVHPAPVARAGSPIPGTPSPAQKPFTVAYVAPVQQAVAERALTGQVRAYPQLPLHLAGDDGVLMIAENRLDLLHLPGEPARLHTERRGHCLTGVTGTLSRFARLMQGHVPGLAG